MSWWSQVAPGVGLPGHGGVYHLHPVGLANRFRAHPTCILLTDAIALALIVSGGYEGRSKLDYHALADDFDGQGTSFGLIQWNFGQGTLGKLLLKMLQLDSAAFAGSFPENTDYEKLKDALLSSNIISQIEWAENIIRNNRIGWKKAFTALGDVEAFQEVQLREAARFHDNVEGCVIEMRRLFPSLMVRVELRTYVALYDLCVQQGGLNRGKTLENIRIRLGSEKVNSQQDLLKICVHERAKTASRQWAADCLSRRLGIIVGSSQAVELNGVNARRANANFHILEAYEGKHVCEI
ncbi:hypothetical protein [Pseudomonas sp. NPDC090201]|uniref:hypothetical protein n=1 Tax=Pseudomonas sp. NPDC090201 TaxID=3364475 RepID=UPI0038285CDE